MTTSGLVNSISQWLSLEVEKQQTAMRTLAEYPQKEPEWDIPRRVNAGIPARSEWDMPRKVNISRQSSCTYPSEASSPLEQAASRFRSVSIGTQSTCVGGSDVSDSCSNPGSEPGSVDVCDPAWMAGRGAAPRAATPLSLAAAIPAPPPGLSAKREQFPPMTPSKQQVCTLKIKNLPRRCTQQEILKAVEEIGFGKGYDFFFLPVGPESKQNRGYAFMNFRDPVTAANFRQAFSGYRIREKAVEVVAAPVQGLVENMMRYSKPGDKGESNYPKLLVLSF